MIIFVVHAKERRRKQAMLKRLYLAHHLHHPVALNVTQKWLKDILKKTHNIFGVVQTFHDVQELEDFS